MHRFDLSGSFCWGYFAKNWAKMFAKQAQNFPEMFANYFYFNQVWQILWKKLLLESSSFAKDWQNIVTWGNAIPSRRFLGGFVVFLQSWMFLQSYGVFANFCAKYFANFFATRLVIKKMFLQFIRYSFILQFYFVFFSCYCGTVLKIPEAFKIYFLKEIVELERYEAWNLALQINDVTLSSVVTRRSAEPKIQWSHLFLGFS